MQAGLVLALLGGVQKPGGTLGASGHHGAIHVLLCGAPGMSQSPLLEVGLQAAFYCWTSYVLLIQCPSEGFTTLWDLIESCKGVYKFCQTLIITGTLHSAWNRLMGTHVKRLEWCPSPQMYPQL